MNVNEIKKKYTMDAVVRMYHLKNDVFEGNASRLFMRATAKGHTLFSTAQDLKLGVTGKTYGEITKMALLAFARLMSKLYETTIKPSDISLEIK